MEDKLDPNGEAQAVARWTSRAGWPRTRRPWPMCTRLSTISAASSLPYALARADELAVVGRDDEVNLNVMIDLAMQRAGVSGSQTAKQSGKEICAAYATPYKMGV